MGANSKISVQILRRRTAPDLSFSARRERCVRVELPPITMFTRTSTAGYVTALPGIARRTLCHGVNTLLTEFRLQGGNTLPAHHHPQEQTGYLISGHLRLRIGDREHDVRPGDAWCIPANVEHQATILEDSVALEVFSPVRTDYLPPALSA